MMILPHCICNSAPNHTGQLFALAWFGGLAIAALLFVIFMPKQKH